LSERKEATKCPVCGVGDFVDVTYRQGASGAEGEPIQTADTRQVQTFSCGHEVEGPRLDETAAGTADLEVERRSTEDTVDPPEPS
jgi:hypothetical protein